MFNGTGILILLLNLHFAISKLVRFPQKKIGQEVISIAKSGKPTKWSNLCAWVNSSLAHNHWA
jgi:hypothetical protein